MNDQREDKCLLKNGMREYLFLDGDLDYDPT